jgi:exodeoxyribonuclease VII small subunit
MSSGKKSVKKSAEENLKFEEAISRLEKIVQELEGSDVPLEEALAMFEEGVRLSKACHQKLSEAEKKVQVLIKNGMGELQEEPFEGVEEEDGGQGGSSEDFEPPC